MNPIRPIKKVLFCVSIVLFLAASSGLIAEGQVSPPKHPAETRVPILLYHRLGPKVVDGMTVRTDAFAAEMKYIKENGYTVIRLRQLIDFFLKKGPPPPPKSVVIVADDGHKSIYSDMLPIVKKYRFPVTLFLYPSAISNASYAMTWDQIRALQKTGLFEAQGHTYWHPNFQKEKKRLKPAEYDNFVEMQLKKSRDRLEKELGVTIDMLAWPFGIYDEELMRRARLSGYIAAFTIERRRAAPNDNIMSVPRFLMTGADTLEGFEKLLSEPK